MLQESCDHSAIQIFEKDQRPIFVLYGTDPHFEEIIHDFQEYFQKRDDVLYLFLDMEQEKYDVPEKTFFEILQQLVSSLIDHLPESDQNPQLFSIFRSLWNLRKKTRDYEAEDQLAEFVRFTEFSCYPTLRDVLCRSNQPIVIGFHQFEKVVGWGNKIYNFILEDLLKALEGVQLRFVLFTRSDQKPGLFYGSNEESTKKRILFYKLL